MDNSIRLKELQVASGALRKGDEGFGFFFFFSKRFFWVRRGGWGNSTPFQRRFFLGWGLTQRLFRGWHGKEKFGCFSKQEGGIFFNFSKNYSFDGVGSGVWRK